MRRAWIPALMLATVACAQWFLTENTRLLIGGVGAACMWYFFLTWDRQDHF